MHTLALACGAFLLVPAVLAQDPAPPASARHRTPAGLGLDGYDPVACFPAGGGKAVAGDARFEARAGGATGTAGGPVSYRFASAEHKAWFLAEPARYEPAYGGFDAVAMAAGERKAPAPGICRAIGGRLFAFADPAAAAAFDAAAAARADQAWTKLTGELPRGAARDDARVGVRWNLGKQGLALDGHDPVAYFPEGGGKPRAGDPRIETVLDGARYRFASEAHRAWFLAEPSRYRPKYGGWCAYAMVEGDDVEIDPESFLIEGGRLLLFYKGFLADTRAKWIPRAKDLGPKADAMWAKHG